MNLENLERDLRTYRPAGMEGLPAEFVWPRYEGLSVGNVPATVAQVLGAATTGCLPPLRSDLLAGLTDGVRRVVLVLLDALGWEQLRRVLAQDDELIFHRLAEQGRLLPLTTIFPSTTNNVLSTLRTGAPPVRHGLLAYELYLREWQMAVECITFSPLAYRAPGQLEAWGFDAEHFLPVPTLSQQLSVQGILSYQVIAKRLVNGALSQMHYRGLRHVYTHHYASDLWFTLRTALQEHRGERFLLSAYWSAVDTLAHHYGPLHETGPNEVRALSYLFKTVFLDALTPADREGTLLLVLADHGQITTPPESAILLDDYPVLRDALYLPPLGESRTPFFYIRAGQEKVVWDYLREHFSTRFTFLSRDEAIRSGLLGPGEPYVEVPHRLGDIVGLAHGNSFIVRDEELVHKLRGRHGGLTHQEMLVPLLAVRLDA
ncbi:MAG: hypothetical protein DRI37_02710 [Chloroflexi bacterium]|nr:MAG: hypothetical protein DRI37_02710 [Chloroflexota bacterium]